MRPPPNRDTSPRFGFASISRPDQKDLRQCWRTHPDVFARLHAIFRFTVDACASKRNALLPRYWTEADNAFDQDWSGERVFCNPPFKLSREAMEKARSARLAVIVVPVTTFSNKYLAENLPDHICLPARRLKFLPPLGLKAKSTSVMPTALVLYGASPSHITRLARFGSVYARGYIPA